MIAQHSNTVNTLPSVKHSTCLLGVLVLLAVSCTVHVVESRDSPSASVTNGNKVATLSAVQSSKSMYGLQKTRSRRDSRDSGSKPEMDEIEEVKYNTNDDGDSETGVISQEAKRYMSFRSDLGKRKPFRSDLGRKRSNGYDVMKRYSAFRSDLGKRRMSSDLDAHSATDQKRYMSFRSDLGKRFAGYDADDEVEFDAEKRYAGFRSDLGKRRDEVSENVDNDEEIFGNDEKRYASFRSDLGKRLVMPPGKLTENKKATSYFRTDLGKRPVGFRSDLGK